MGDPGEMQRVQSNGIYSLCGGGTSIISCSAPSRSGDDLDYKTALMLSGLKHIHFLWPHNRGVEGGALLGCSSLILSVSRICLMELVVYDFIELGLPVHSQGDSQSDNKVMDNITVRQGETVFLSRAALRLPN
ncbi:hypothetical protein NQZ68_015960 [Dissostichus eleginoides]|nr:hypothetical protein NQZ68_015960 [Dissostichus eleginoides]